jgi:hypothetical protein
MKKMFSPRLANVCTLLAFLTCFCACALAQSDVGTITGFVKDPSGAVVPSAKVIVKSEATGEEHTVTTDGSGHYTVPSLLPGLYTLRASAPGFKEYISRLNRLEANSTIELDGNLTVGQTTETVEVSATAAVLQTESSAVQAEVNGKQIQDQELNGRSPLYSAQLLPGVRSGGTLGDFNGTGLGGNPFAVNGTRSQDTLVTVDGAPAMRTRANGAVIGVGDVDATAEIQVLTADYAAEYGQAAGGQIRMVTKSGTHDFHGSAYEYFRNSDLNANTWGRNLSTTTNFASPFRFNNFGYTVGGPAAIPGKWDKLRDKLFFFVAQDWIRYRNTQTQTQAVPTNLMRTGNFSELLPAGNPWISSGRQLYYPSANCKLNTSTYAPVAGSACTPITNNVIPASMMSPNGLAILNAYPTATPGYVIGASNWIAQASQPENQRKDIWNMDIIPNNNNHIELRRSGLAYNEFDPFDQGTNFTQKYFNRPNQTNTAAWTYTINPTMVNELRATYSLDDVYIPVKTSDIGFNRQDLALPITYPYLFAGKDLPNKIPNITVNDSFYNLAAGPYPSHSSGPIFTASDSLTKVWGNHTIKFGMFYEYAGENDGDQINVSTVPGGASNQNGNFIFSDAGVNGGISTSGAGIANLLFGNADSYTEIGPRALTIWRRPLYEEFAQDSWKVNSKLHVDYGVRMTTVIGFHPLWGNADYFDGALYNPAQAVSLNSAGNVILGSGNPYNGMVIPGLSSFPSSALGRVGAASQNICDGASCSSLFAPNLRQGYIKPTNDLQPRLGFAYQLTDKVVLRAGGGEFTTAMPLLDNIFPGGNSPFQPFVTINNVKVDNPGASLSSTTAASITATTLNPNLKQPAAWNWNVTVEAQMPLKSVLSVAYVGHRGYHAWQVYDINQAPVGALQAAPTGTNINLLRPYKGYAAIQEEESTVNSQYNGLQLSWNRRYANGFMFGLSYTYSKSMDNGSNYRDIVPDTYNTSNLWGPSEYDTRHILIINYQYHLPFFKNETTLAGKLLGGWDIVGQTQFQTGTPCGVGSSQDFAGVSTTDLGSFGCGSEGQFWVENGNPNIVGGFAGSTSASNATQPTWFAVRNPNGTSIFTAPAAGTFNLQPGVRDSIYQPGLQDWNVSMFKRFVVRESDYFEFRAEAYDFINHPNWSGPNLNPTSGQFGEITGKTGLQRTLQLGLRFNF